MSSKRISERYMWTVIAAGVVCLITAVLRAEYSRADVYLVLLAMVTVAIGPRAVIKIPRFKSHISVSDTLIFLTLLVYGGEFAVVLATIEAATSAWRFCNRKLTVFFNAATLGISTTAVVVVLRTLFSYTGTPINEMLDEPQN